MKSCPECGALYMETSTAIGIVGIRENTYCKFCGVELCPN